MWQVPHLVAWFCEELEVFGPSFFGSGLASIGSFRDGIAGDHEEQLLDELLLFTRLSSTGADDVGPVSDGIKASFEADPAKLDEIDVGGLLHERPHEVVRYEVDLQFPNNHFRALTLENVEV